MMPIFPVTPTLEIEIDISNSCNDCCRCLPWKKKQTSPSGTKLQQKEIIDKKIQEYKLRYQESYKNSM